MLRSRWSLFGLVGVLGVSAASFAACGSSGSASTEGDTSGTVCTPGVTQHCACPAGLPDGVQACNGNGTGFNQCECGTGTGGTGGGTFTSSSSTGQQGNCGDGIPQGGECDVGGEFYCPQDCMDGGTGDAGDGGNCNGQVTFAGKAKPPNNTVGNTSSNSHWVYNNNLSGVAAGDAMCQAIGADHACDYDDIVLAASKSEITGLATTDTAWLHRTHDVTVNGTTFGVSKASRCDDWNYETDHVNDGEFVSFENGLNTPTYHLDDDPNATQASPKAIPCGNAAGTRYVLCCYPKCTP
jgi:hypothetical protein